MEDSEIIRLYEARNEEAVRQTDLHYGQALFRLSMRILLIREDADENRNDTYMKAWQSIPPEKPVSLGGYLMKLCRNAALDRLRYRKTRKRSAVLVELTEELENCIPDRRQEEQFSAWELGEILNGFLEKLPPVERGIFISRCFEMESIPEIAHDYRYTQGRVRTILWRTRKALKTYLESEGIMP